MLRPPARATARSLLAVTCRLCRRTVTVTAGSWFGWLLPDSVDQDDAVHLAPVESVDILNEALGPLLLALGFPIEPYSADGRWIVTGPRTVD